MLELPCGVGFGVNIGDLFEFQRAFKRDGIAGPAPQLEHVRRFHHLVRQLFERLVMIENVIRT